MSEASPAHFNEGDIVWVKLGSRWWPGEVKDFDSLPEEVGNLKKKPLVVVKFFDEDSYEYVRNWSNIFPYNSPKKEEFIKKGMIAHRAKLSHMEKFPKDVLNAEMRTGGNLNILSEPMFQPEKKRNIVAEIFGTPSPRTKKAKTTNKPSKETGVVTHRRFLGSKNLDDYRAYICIQYPGKDRVPGDQEDEEVIRINREPEEEYNCHSCSFTTRRLEVMIWHSKSHIQGVYVSSPKKYKRPTVPKQKKERSKSEGSKEKRRRTQSPKKPATVTSAEAQTSRQSDFSNPQPGPSNPIRHELLAAEWDDSDEDDMVAGPSNSFNNVTQESADTTEDSTDTTQELPNVTQESTETAHKSKDITNESTDVTHESTDIIRESTDVTHESNDVAHESTDVIHESTDVIHESTDVTHESTDVIRESTGVTRESTDVTHESTDIRPTSPEVPQDKDKSKDISGVGKLDETVNSINSQETNEEIEEEPLVVPSKSNNVSEPSKSLVESEESQSPKKNMDTVIREAIKSCFDFDEEEEEPLVTTAVSGRKIPRVIPITGRKKSSDLALENREVKRDEIPNVGNSFNKKKSEKKKDNDEIDIAFRELMETTALPELPDVQNALKCEQNFHNIETIKFPDKPSDAGGSSVPKSTTKEKNDTSEIATKLTNPKKRFVKSFEDFELMQNQIRRQEENKYDESMEIEDVNDNDKMLSKNAPLAEVSPKGNAPSEVPPSKSSVGTSATRDDECDNQDEKETLKFAKLKTKIMSKIIAEAKMNEESKNRIMSLMTAKKPTSESQPTTKPSPPRARRAAGIHRTPRSKILECYQKDQVSDEKRKLTETVVLPLQLEESSKHSEGAIVTTVEEKVVPPKKNKWSRRGGHPKKDRKFVIEETKPEKSHDLTVSKDKSTIVPTTPGSIEDVDNLKNGDKMLSKNFNDVEDLQDVSTIQSASTESTLDVEQTLTNNISLTTKDIKGHHLQEITVDIAPEKPTDEEIFKVYEFPTSGIDDFSPIGHASPALPENAICLPPKKSKKRKHSKTLDDNLWPDLTSDNSSEEKKKRSLDKTDKDEDSTNTEPKTIPELDVNVHVTSQNSVVVEKLCEEIEEATEVTKIENIDEVVAETHKNELIEDVNNVIDTVGTKTTSKEFSPHKTDLEIPVQSSKKQPFDSDVPQLRHEEIVSIPTGVAEELPKEEYHIGVQEMVNTEPKFATTNKHEVSEVVEVVPEQNEVKVSEIDENVPKLESSIEVETVGDVVADVVADLEIKPEVADSETVAEVVVDSAIETELVVGHTPEGVSDVDLIGASVCKIEAETIEDSDTFNPVSDHVQENDSELLVVPNDESSEGSEEKLVESNETLMEQAVSTCVNDPDGTTDEHHNELEIQCGSMSDDVFKFSIQTNLSNFSSRQELSAIAALATLAEIKSDSDSNASEDVTQSKPSLDSNLPEKASPSKPELVPIEGNLTVVSEKDLADGQVEITPKQIINSKKPVMLSNFSMDFSESTSDSASTSEPSKLEDFDSKGTEFTLNAMTRELQPKTDKKGNTYERLELLDILEGNSDVEKKAKQRQAPVKNFMDDICDFEEHIPSQIVCAKKLRQDMEEELKIEKSRKSMIMSTTSKLLERLTEAKVKSKVQESGIVVTDSGTSQKEPGSSSVSTTIKNIKTALQSKIHTSLSATNIKTALEASKQGSKTKRLLNDIEDVEAFVIHKDIKKQVTQESDVTSEKISKTTSKSSKALGKAKILQQTIITPAGEILQPTVGSAQTDDNIFDINSMPIVLSDEIFTPESIEKMPIVLGSDGAVKKTVSQDNVLLTTTANKPVLKKLGKITTTMNQSLTLKTPSVATKINKVPRILQTVGSKVIKQSSPMMAKPGKYIILPQNAGIPAGKIIAKKTPVLKRTPATGIISTPEPSGNKIMIFTNQQGQQQRLLLTPAQQKMLGYQSASSKVTKTIVKGNVLQKSVVTTKGSSEAGTSGVTPKTSIVGQKVVITTNPSSTLILNTGQHVISGVAPQIRSIKVPKKAPSVTHQKLAGNTTNKTQKTILITTKQGQPVRKIQGTEEELEKQVAEQLEAIRASSGMKFGTVTKPADTSNYKQLQKTPKRTFSRKPEVKFKSGPPSLVEIPSPKKEVSTSTTITTTTKVDSSQVEIKTTPPSTEAKPKPDRPLNQLVIQDAVGNQTTITEGQILALPSETVDGQPQSYMLVTLDESGNLTPLNNEALMSLDPNLGLGGDLSNMVLQIDQSALTGGVVERLPLAQPAIVKTNETKLPQSVVPAQQLPITTEIVEQKVPELLPISESSAAAGIQSMVTNSNGEPGGQQLIVTGDPIATQKFLESLSEGTTDLANILANADGNSILIQADGQQILINTNSDNQMLLSVNSDNVNVSENTEGGGNPIFATQPSKNQDILAAALADTDVFQSDQHTQSKITSQLSPNNTLYPMNVSNVLETSLTLSSPIMTPLEVPSTNNKKIPDDEADMLTQLPKNVDLPITITDPNISQTVANQQVASLIASELQANLDLGLPISESTISTVSTDINSPSYSYSLPTLDDSVDISHKPFNSSMPLLNEDVEEAVEISKSISIDERLDDNMKDTARLSSDDAAVTRTLSKKPEESINADGAFLEDEGRFTLGGGMCSSLSEPPPEMFDIPEKTSGAPGVLKDEDVGDLSTQAESSNEGSCEIPLQPQIVTKSGEVSDNMDSIKRSLGDSQKEKV